MENTCKTSEMRLEKQCSEEGFFLHVQCSIRHKEKKSNLVDFPHFLWDISGCACVCMNAQMESGRRRRQKTLHYATNVFGVLFF